MPRRSKYSPATRDAILGAVALGLTYEQAAAAAGIHRDTLHTWRTRYPTFSDALKKATVTGMLTRLTRIEEAAKDGAWTADAWWLERHFPEQWGRRQRVDAHVETSGNGPGVYELVQAIGTIFDEVVPREDPQIRAKLAARLMELDAELEAKYGPNYGDEPLAPGAGPGPDQQNGHHPHQRVRHGW